MARFTFQDLQFRRPRAAMNKLLLAFLQFHCPQAAAKTVLVASLGMRRPIS
jgi:hypothetical protein